MNGNGIKIKAEDSFVRRYFYKLFGAFVAVAANAAIQIILPRALSIDDYGYYIYNLNIFTQIFAVMNLSVPSALHAKIAKRASEYKLLKGFSLFYLVLVLVLNIIIIAARMLGVLSLTFGGQTLGVVLLALNAFAVTQVVQDAAGVFDDYALTRYSEIVQAVVKCILTVIIALLYAFAMLSIDVFYILHISTYMVILLALFLIFLKKQMPDIGKADDSHSYKEYIAEFYEYCKPVFLAGLFGCLVNIASNWLLLYFGGTQEQALYGVAWQLNSLILYTFTPLVALFRREYAIYAGEKIRLLEKYILSKKVILMVAGYFAFFIIINVKGILQALFGDEYIIASTVTQLIMIYTVFQSAGQLNGSLFLSIENTAKYAKLTVISQIVNMLAVLIFQTPNALWPAGLGSIGIGLALVVSNMVSIPLLGISLCRQFKASYIKAVLWPAIRSTIVLVILAAAASFAVGAVMKLFGVDSNVFLNVFISGVLYTAAVVVCTFKLPALFGINREQVQMLIARIRVHKG